MPVIIPMYNERDYIGKCLDGSINQNYPKNKYKIIVVDGNSNDGSDSVVVEYQKKFSNLKLLSNKKRITSVSFNIGIKATDADCVGGPMKAVSDTIVGKAISYATSTPLGVGNSVFHYSKKLDM